MKMMKKMKESLSSNLLISLKVSPLKMRRSKAKKMKMVGLQWSLLLKKLDYKLANLILLSLPFPKSWKLQVRFIFMNFTKIKSYIN